MEIGMLWYDGDQDTELGVKVARVAAYYAQKYGVDPNLCFEHPEMLAAGYGKNGSTIAVRGSISICRDYLWIGQDDELNTERRAANDRRSA